MGMSGLRQSAFDASPIELWSNDVLQRTILKFYHTFNRSAGYHLCDNTLPINLMHMHQLCLSPRYQGGQEGRE